MSGVTLRRYIFSDQNPAMDLPEARVVEAK